MAEKIQIFSWNVFGRKLANYLALGLAGLTIWFGAEGVSHLSKKWVLERRMLTEQRAIEKKIESEKERGLSKLNEAINQWDADEAFKVIGSLKQDSIYTLEEMADMKKKADEISEDGLYQKIKSASKEDIADLAERYLKIYPDGEYKKDVVRSLLVSMSSELLTNLQSKQGFNGIYQQLNMLNSILKKHSDEKLDLPGVYLEKLVEQGKNYLGEKEKIAQELAVGNLVKVKSSIPSEWGDEYFADREKTIPTGSAGELLEIREVNHKGIEYKSYVVKFEDIQKYYWRRNFEGPLPYWQRNGGKKNIAFYRKEELEPAPFNEIEKEEFMLELNNLRDYAQGIVKNAKD